MNRRKHQGLDLLTRSIASLDEQTIDRLYGLEPVYEPAASHGGPLPEEFLAFLCPYCGERLSTRVDLTSDEPTYIEDCEVCCRPIELEVEREEGGGLRSLRVQRLD